VVDTEYAGGARGSIGDGRLIETNCDACDVGWSLQGSGSPSSDDVQVFGTAGVLIIPSRRLRPDEVRRMFARPAH
jgi:hypothetical protein